MPNNFKYIVCELLLHFPLYIECMVIVIVISIVIFISIVISIVIIMSIVVNNAPSYLAEQNSPLYSASSRTSDSTYRNMNDVIENGTPTEGGSTTESTAMLRDEIQQLKDELARSKSTIGKLKEKEKAMRDRYDTKSWASWHP